MNLSIATLGSFAISIITLAGCSGGSASQDGAGGAFGAASAADSSTFCESYCTKKESCDGRMDAQTCTTKCEDGVSASLKKRRADVVSGAAACFESSDCRQVLGGERLGECLGEAAVSIAPSPAVKSFCDGLVKALDRCDVRLDRAACLDETKVFSDPTLAQAESCLVKSCSQMGPCVKATFGLTE